ncbi:DUF3085 domain-containing protein [Bradyrhizobium sp. CB2312]|uniref:DUF3085 domain-containing protein n=1 Tax=Bradyrhizobium sp. CB2312 TaxID=3039155 RepID=UPI0024B175E0|nr:DUF3085 domain-containing protein [Bradyrhizobium sp. CB2312]WFU75586.1 DUF3085 domain-containing protein [Bradyrhizobium sp. CB2312]
MKLSFPHGRLKTLWAEAVQQWPIAVRPMNGRSSPGFWLIGGHGIFLMHNGAKPKGGPTLAYATECDPCLMQFQEWLCVKRAVFGNGGMEFVEAVMIGTAIDAGCDIEIMLDRDSMTVALIEGGKAGIRWQSSRSNLALDRYY